MQRRKMLASDKAIANEVSSFAKSRGLTVYQTVNEMLRQALKSEKLRAQIEKDLH